jgi:hypothetical protein
VTSSELCPFDINPNKGWCVDDMTGERLDPIVHCDPVDGDPGCPAGSTCEQSGQFRALMTPDTKNFPAYKHNATNPGQFYYNLVHEGLPGDTLTIVVPWPFVTQGGRPVHVYDAAKTIIDEDGCFLPCFNSSTACDALLANDTMISIDDWISGGTNASGVTCDMVCGPDGVGTCSFDVVMPDNPEVDCVGEGSCSYYVNVHLDWGLKGPHVDANPCDDGHNDRYDIGDQDTVFGGWDALANDFDDPNNNSGPVAITNCRTFDFCHDTTSISSCGTAEFSDGVENINIFKPIKGAFGTANSKSRGKAILEGTPVELIRVDTGELIRTSATDEDGYYTLDYKHTGPRADFRVNLLGGYNLSTVVELRANGWAQVNFDVDTGIADVEVGCGGSNNCDGGGGNPGGGPDGGGGAGPGSGGGSGL